MLIDEVLIRIKAGSGGRGAATFRRNGQTAKGGPDGGNGGMGGDVYIEGVDDITVLSVFRFKKDWSAEDGVNGAKQNLFGRKGKDLVLKVPVGTSLTDTATGQIYEIVKKERLLIAKGGTGGRGNNEFKSATNQTPRFAEDGRPGEQKELQLRLRLIADVGIIGLPNAGKSSLLDALTNANPKVGDYPFTTIEPNLGVIDGVVLADIPGLIEGASSGKGLGTAFLKHIEKTSVLLHCIDVSADSPLKDYKVIKSEFEKYNPELFKKKEVVLLTKSDTVSQKDLKKKASLFEKKGLMTLAVSILDDESLVRLRELILSLAGRGAES